jgi:hypothetical protein
MVYLRDLAGIRPETSHDHVNALLIDEDMQELLRRQCDSIRMRFGASQLPLDRRARR